MTPWGWILVAAGASAAAFFAGRGISRRKIIGKIEFMSDAVTSGETAFRYRQEGVLNRRLNSALNRLRGIFEQEQSDIREREHYFATMLDHVSSGVIVLSGENVEYCNAPARGLLGMSEISTLGQIELISAPLAEVFRSAGESEMHAEFPSERGPMHLAVSCCDATLHSHPVRLVTFNDITRDMENNETESWMRLIRVLTHEIMNSVTPVASLSSAISRDIDSYGKEDIRAALGTIAASSEGLINFVNSYRSLTHIAAPQRRAVYFREIAGDAIALARSAFPAVSVTYAELSDDIILYADQGQISQVVNNLVKNAAQAGARNVRITAEIDKKDRTVINVSNDGEPISESSREQLFVPFFTTKGSGGTGVGLSLSRQMVRLNGGTLNLASSTPSTTTFTMIF